MTNISPIYVFYIIACTLIGAALCTSRCSVLECWFVQEKSGRGGGFSVGLSQEKSLLHIRTDPDSEKIQPRTPADVDPSRIYHVIDPAATFCHSALHPPEGTITKPQCEINPFTPQASMVKWAAALTESAQSPVYLNADWFSSAAQGVGGKLTLSNVMRATTGTKAPSVILSVSSKHSTVRFRLGEPVVLDCGFWVNPSSPLHSSGFAVEWRYQFRGEGRLVLAYDAKTDRFADSSETDADLDFVKLHESGNATLVIKDAQVRHAGTYICTIYLPHLLAQVAMELEIVEPPTLVLYPSPLPLTLPGQVVTVHCEASGFTPLSLTMSWKFTDTEGKTQSLGQGRMTGHRQARDGTFSQGSHLELDPHRMGLERGGEVICIANHQGGFRRANVTLNVISVTSPSIEDSMAMVAVGLVLYGVIKVLFWAFTSTNSNHANANDKKEK